MNFFQSMKPPSSMKTRQSTFQDERFALIFDFETTGLPLHSWTNYEPEPTIKRRKDGVAILQNKIIFDEVTGKKKFCSSTIPLEASNPEDWPYAVQFAYILYDIETKTAKMVNEIVRLPENVIMTEGSERIHGISLSKSQGKTKTMIDLETGKVTKKYNREIHDILREFMEDFRKADVLVAHNLQFDRNMLLVEMDRLRRKPGMEDFNEYIKEVYHNKKEYCTMDFGKDMCKIAAVNIRGESYYKMPKLVYLYNHLFQYYPKEEKMHDALMDVVACMRCFYKMRYNVDIIKTNQNMELVKMVDSFSPTQEYVRRSSRIQFRKM